jgi:hypothetical protein
MIEYGQESLGQHLETKRDEIGIEIGAMVETNDGWSRLSHFKRAPRVLGYLLLASLRSKH